jgi:hypothetical protein
MQSVLNKGNPGVGMAQHSLDVVHLAFVGNAPYTIAVNKLSKVVATEGIVICDQNNHCTCESDCALAIHMPSLGAKKAFDV